MNDRPLVTLTYAQSLDGRIATAVGDSQWISGDRTLDLAHRLRNEHDGILVGIGTVLRDNPQLTCRLPVGRNPHRVVLDSHLRTPLHSHIAGLATQVATTIICSADADPRRRDELESAGVTIQTLRSDGDHLHLPAVLGVLADLGIESLLVEGGSAVLTSFFAHRAIDRLVLVSAPVVIGCGVPAVGDLGVAKLADAWRGTTASVRQMGEDIVWEVRFG